MAGDWKAIRAQLGNWRDRVREELSGGRSVEVQRQIDEIRGRVGGALEGEDAQRIQREVLGVSRQARTTIDDVLADERTKVARSKAKALIWGFGARVQEAIDRASGETSGKSKGRN